MSYLDNFNPRVPGEMDGMQFVDKQILMYADHHIKDRISITIAPNTGDLDKGTILGITTADSLFRPVRRYALTANAASGAVSVVVAVGATFNVGDTVSVMKANGTGVESVGTVSSTSVSGGNLTVTFSTATAEALVIGDYIFVSDGSQTALLVLAEVVQDATANKIASAYVSGKFFLTALVGVDSFVTSDLKARSIPYGNNPITGNAESIYIV